MLLSKAEKAEFEKIKAKALAIYHDRIEASITDADKGKFLIIDPQSGDYEMNANCAEAWHRLEERQPNSKVYTMKIGYPTPFRATGRFAAALLGERLKAVE